MSEQNRAAEHENHMVVELARSMLSVSRLPKPMWAQACETAVYVLYHAGKISVIGKSPMEMWNGHVMKNLDHLRVIGMECFVYTPKQFRKIFDKKSVFGQLIGYLNDKDVYQVHVPSLKKIVHSHDIYFSQNEFAPVHWLKQGWKTQLWKMWLRRKGKKVTQCWNHRSQIKPSRWRPRKSFPGTQNDQYAQ